MSSLIDEEALFSRENAGTVLNNNWNERSDWPFDWDWDCLFPCPAQDFRLWELPIPALLETMKQLDNDTRRNMSFTCQKFRNLIIENQTPSMDRRVIVDLCELEISDDFTLHSDQFYKCFDDLKSLGEWTQSFEEKFSCKEIYIDMKDVIEIEKVVESLNGLNMVVSSHFDYDYGYTRKVDPLIDAFMKYPQLKRVHFDNCDSASWDKYCTTVKEWAEDKGMIVRDEDGGSDGWFSKSIKNGITYLDVTSPSREHFQFRQYLEDYDANVDWQWL